MVAEVPVALPGIWTGRSKSILWWCLSPVRSRTYCHNHSWRPQILCTLPMLTHIGMDEYTHCHSQHLVYMRGISHFSHNDWIAYLIFVNIRITLHIRKFWILTLALVLLCSGWWVECCYHFLWCTVQAELILYAALTMVSTILQTLHARRAYLSAF